MRVYLVQRGTFSTLLHCRAPVHPHIDCVHVYAHDDHYLTHSKFLLVAAISRSSPEAYGKIPTNINMEVFWCRRLIFRSGRAAPDTFVLLFLC